MGSGFLAQGVVVCNRCDSGITLFAIQSATADQLIHVPLLTSICIYLISVHIPIALIFLRCFSSSAYTGVVPSRKPLWWPCDACRSTKYLFQHLLTFLSFSRIIRKNKKGSVADANIREPKYRIQTRIRP